MKCATGCGKDVPDTEKHREVHGNYCSKCSEKAGIEHQKRHGRKSEITKYTCVTCKKTICGSWYANYEKEGWECERCTPYLQKGND